ncbi:phage antirepressor [Pseudomonas plecoglossicida]|uniref:phage antirepressor n=1 Tax=Pseudomonas plecoglossicida TaxID=70775 RepID=UPI0015E33B7B|nr:phage antirepressor [Pseudomonas plecoglossicida]MBA1195760.1 phage antirepressor [Pseudomonas plecoglossicida]
MNLATTTGSTMPSTQLRDLINDAREQAGEPKIRNDQLIAKIEDELEGELGVCTKIAHPQSGALMDCYDLTRDQCLLVGMRESKAVRRRVTEKLKELEGRAPRSMTQAELIAASANQLVAIERQQAAHQVVLERVERQVADLSQTMVWDHCPQNCLSLSGVKSTMLARYGLSGAVVDYVLKEWPHQPNPAGMVRNGHEDAKGSQYLVWTKTLVTAAFKRFVDECEMVNATQASHPYFNGRFRLAGKVHP